MKRLLLLSATTFITVLLLGYTFNKHEVKPLYYISCINTDTKIMIQEDAANPEFAMLHAIPKPFVLQNPIGKTIFFPAKDGINAQGYFIKANNKSNKWLLVIQEWWGLNDYIKKEAETFYNDLDNVNVLALDMYDGKVATTRDSASAYMRNTTTERFENIVKAAITYAGSNAKIYTVGWCFGGGWSLQSTMLAGKQAAGCVMYYGRPETNIERLKTIQCDVIGFFGNLDKGIPSETVDTFEKNMKDAGKTLYLYRYEAGHGFANPSNPVFNKEATEDAYAKAIDFLKKRM
ncbi:MAG: dienelactone hydrolase family protein [Chitinophagaceae bacterium]|nr:dienelactone hydrolase family protein [Chitinophagaceae bacterium]MCW5904460.1 dienelactone hydrolase family protein [Chitinophagaceae bacterium]